ncbi:zinc-dependent peptidase [Marinobacter sp.]|uniref:M90 family metallopeptidase n=1 Tax=Marinobacter sp. TaxID=50741 RepID=UPI0035684841
MSPAVIFVVFATLLLSGSVFYLFFYRNWRRKRELEQPFPKPWRKILRHQAPHYNRLSKTRQKRLENLIQLFVSEKEFYGCAGFEVDDRVKVTVAGHACLLILERAFTSFDEVRSILIYPDVYKAKGTHSDGMVVSTGEQLRAGEASSRGQVVLAWSECEQAIAEPYEPHNVILHEFAHQLDYLDGTADGAPPLSGEQAQQWQETMTKAWEHLRQRLKQRKTPWLDPYGATQPAEFFAVLTEAFFQQPDHLQQEQPKVYEALKRYYRLDPRDFTTHHP